MTGVNTIQLGINLQYISTNPTPDKSDMYEFKMAFFDDVLVPDQYVDFFYEQSHIKAPQNRHAVN